MHRIVLTLALAGLCSPAVAQTTVLSSSDPAVAEEAERIRQFHRSLGVIPAPSSQDGIKNIPVYAPSDTDEGTDRIHVTLKGDTLFGLSKRYGISVASLRDANSLQGNSIRLGQSLIIPPSPKAAEMQTIRRIVRAVPVEDETRDVSGAPEPAQAVYAVLPKDTLSAISRRTCVGVKELVAENALEKPEHLVPGQRLTLPTGHCLPK